MNNRFSLYRIFVIFFFLLFLFFSINPLDTGKGDYFSPWDTVSADETPVPGITGIRMIIPESVEAGTYLRIIDTIRNKGSKSSGPFSIAYILNDSSGIQDDIILGTVSVQNLVPGGQKSVNITMPVPWEVTPGEYQLHRILETSKEENNDGTQTYLSGNVPEVQVMKTNEFGLIGYFEGLTLSVIEGNDLSISSIVENTNFLTPIDTRLSYYLSKTGHIIDEVIFIGESEDLHLNPQDKQTDQINLPLSNDIPSEDYYLIASFLPIELITPDSNLYWVSDNTIAISSYAPTIEPIPPNQPVSVSSEPDIMTVRTDYPDLMYIGESVKITDTVTNIGSSTAGIVRVEYLLSPHEDGTDASHMGWWTLHNLKGGESRTSQETIGIPGQTRTGIFYLTKKITVTSSPPEKNTANNFWTGNRPVRIEYNPAAVIPDLAHVSTKFPCGVPGQDAEIIDTLTNIGNACAEHVSVAYYVSPYAEFDTSTARYLGVWEVNRICVGEQLTHTTKVTVPADLTNGEYYWYSVIDPCSFMPYCGDEMPELDKSNNINIGQLRIGPCVFCGC